MFSVYHLAWLAIDAVFIVLVLRFLKQKQLPLETFLNWACIIAAISEFIKVFANIGMVASADGTAMHMFME